MKLLPTKLLSVFHAVVWRVKRSLPAQKSTLPYDFNCPRCGHPFWQGMFLEYTSNPERYFVQCKSLKCAWQTPYFKTEREALEYFRRPPRRVRANFV